MNRDIFWLTIRELAGRRRLALVVLLGVLPSLVSVAYRLGDQNTAAARWTADTLLYNVIITIFLPLVALIFGTSALGSEVEDGTAIFLLSKPVTRGSVISAKLMAAWALTAVFVVPAAAVSGAIAIWGTPEQGIITGFVVACVLGALAYDSLFVMLSAFTTRALFVGLAYVFIWEGIINSIFSGTRFFSIRQCCLGVAALISSAPEETFSANLSGLESIVILAVAVVVPVWAAVRLLRMYQVGESG
jgi:ABC-2 type transport system permease protein